MVENSKKSLPSVCNVAPCSAAVSQVLQPGLLLTSGDCIFSVGLHRLHSGAPVSFHIQTTCWMVGKLAIINYYCWRWIGAGVLLIDIYEGIGLHEKRGEWACTVI